MFLDVDTIEEAEAKLESALGGCKRKKHFLETQAALGSVLAEDVFSTEDIPGFARSTMDGYAVRALDTGGSSDGLPAILAVAGEVRMGGEPDFEVRSGECALIPTGGMLPQGTDAVVMAENTEYISDDETGICKAVSAGENTVRADEDIAAGRLVLKNGTRLRPQEIGVLAALGVEKVRVYLPWSITVISTGDELVPPEQVPGKGQVRDINTDAISALASSIGMTVIGKKVVRDEEELLRKAVEEAMPVSDIVAVSGGSSKGRKDATARIFREVSDSGILTHGLALKPGKPTILSFDKKSETILLGLPGHPAAAMMVFRILVRKLWCSETGEKEPFPVSGRMSVNLPSAPGRMTCQPVSLTEEASSDGTRSVTPVSENRD